MGFTLTHVHETAKDPNTGLDRVTGENPYVRLKQGDFAPLYIQGGLVYDESGNVMRSLPDWFEEELAKVSPAQLARCGYHKARAGVTPITAKADKPKRKYTKKQKADPVEDAGSEEQAD